MPDFDFDAFNHDTPYEGEDGQSRPYNNDAAAPAISTMEAAVANLTETPIDKMAVEEVAENIENPTETNNAPVDNGSADVVEKW